MNRHQELVDAIREDILAIGSIYRTVGDALFDEPITRLAERIAGTVKERCAAAPDLLAALQGLLDAEIQHAREVVEFGPGGTTEEQIALRLIEAREEAARAAIAKAEPPGSARLTPERAEKEE